MHPNESDTVSRAAAIEAAEAHFASGAFTADLAKRVAIATESPEPASGPTQHLYLEAEMRPLLERLGFAVTILANPVEARAPLLLAERHEADDRPTVLSYGHGDVLGGMAGDWADDLEPFRLTARDGRLYGRGTVDNKGQHSINLAAIERVLEQRGRLGFNLKILLEMGEELGSPGLADIARAHQARLAADVLIASDGPRITADRPTIFLGLSRLLELRSRLPPARRCPPLGQLGRPLGQPRHRAQPRAQLHHRRQGPHSDRRLEAGRAHAYRPRADPRPGPRAGARRSRHRPRLGRARSLAAGEGLCLEQLRDPGHDRRPPGATGERHPEARRARTASSATSRTSTQPTSCRRCAPISTPMATPRSRSSRPARASSMRLEPIRTMPGWRWRGARSRSTTGKRPAVLPSFGGSLPNEVFADILGMPTVWIPHSHPGCSQHAPNEHMLESIAKEGLAIMTGLFWDIGDATLVRSGRRRVLAQQALMLQLGPAVGWNG